MSKGLEKLKTIRHIHDMECGGDESINKDFDIVERELKALEIIKEKPQATLWLIQHCDKEMEYEDMISLFKEDITKEQFYLLKEELCHKD